MADFGLSHRNMVVPCGERPELSLLQAPRNRKSPLSKDSLPSVCLIAISGIANCKCARARAQFATHVPLERVRQYPCRECAVRRLGIWRGPLTPGSEWIRPEIRLYADARQPESRNLASFLLES